MRSLAVPASGGEARGVMCERGIQASVLRLKGGASDASAPRFCARCTPLPALPCAFRGKVSLLAGGRCAALPASLLRPCPCPL